ncbi:MAG: T9SS type A sorting domain-containing protein [Candidatus Kapaibacterium sp.]
MKKLLILLLLLFITTSFAKSQSFTFHRFTPAIVNGDTSFLVATKTKAVFKNTGSINLNFTFFRILNDLPSPDWSTSMCLRGFCYAPFLDSVPPSANPLTILPGQQDTLEIYFNGMTVGMGKVIIKAWVNNNPNNYLTDTFQVHLGPVGIRQISSVVDGYKLEQNYPNPFNPATKINFSLGKRENISLKVYDILGNEVANLINNETVSAGKYTYDFNSSKFNLSSGVYYYTLKSVSFTSTKKMLLIK